MYFGDTQCTLRDNHVFSGAFVTCSVLFMTCIVLFVTCIVLFHDMYCAAYDMHCAFCDIHCVVRDMDCVFRAMHLDMTHSVRQTTAQMAPIKERRSPDLAVTGRMPPQTPEVMPYLWTCLTRDTRSRRTTTVIWGSWSRSRRRSKVPFAVCVCVCGCIRDVC